MKIPLPPNPTAEDIIDSYPHWQREIVFKLLGRYDERVERKKYAQRAHARGIGYA